MAEHETTRRLRRLACSILLQAYIDLALQTEQPFDDDKLLSARTIKRRRENYSTAYALFFDPSSSLPTWCYLAGVRLSMARATALEILSVKISSRSEDSASLARKLLLALFPAMPDEDLAWVFSKSEDY